MATAGRTQKNNIGKHQRIECFLAWLKDFKQNNPPKIKTQQTVKNYK